MNARVPIRVGNVRRQRKHILQKRLADRDFRSFLPFLGIPPEFVEGAAWLKTELTGLGMGIRRPDRLYRSGDGSLHSRVPIRRRRPGHLQVPRLLGDAGGGVQEGKKYSPNHVIVVNLAGIGKRPQQSYPDKSRRGEDCLHFKLRQIFLGNLPGMAANVRKIRARIATGSRTRASLA
jgi:hypothetical protein